MKTSSPYLISGLLPGYEAILHDGVYLILLHATRIPPHILVSVNGKLFSLGVKGPVVDDEWKATLRLIKKHQIPTVFIKLSVPHLFTLDDLRDEIKKYTLSYPRVDIGIATCLTPIKDFCASVYDTETANVNFVYELLPKLYEQKVAGSCYQMFLEKYLTLHQFKLPMYSMNDIFEGIRKVKSGIAV